MKVLVLFLSLLVPARQESEALKARVTALLDLLTNKSMVASLAYVEEDSKDFWLELWKNGFPPHQIMDLQVSENEAHVELQIERRFPYPGGGGEAVFQVPLQLDWFRNDGGQWLVRLPKPDKRVVTPFGTLVEADSTPLGNQPGFNLTPNGLEEIIRTFGNLGDQLLPANGTPDSQKEPEPKTDPTPPIDEKQ